MLCAKIHAKTDMDDNPPGSTSRLPDFILLDFPPWVKPHQSIHLTTWRSHILCIHYPGVADCCEAVIASCLSLSYLMTTVEASTVPLTESGLVIKMEDRKRPAAYDPNESTPPLKKQATSLNGGGKTHPDTDMPWRDDLEVS